MGLTLLGKGPVAQMDPESWGLIKKSFKHGMTIEESHRKEEQFPLNGDMVIWGQEC